MIINWFGLIFRDDFAELQEDIYILCMFKLVEFPPNLMENSESATRTIVNNAIM